MDQQQIKLLAESLLGEYFWWMLGISAALFFKTAIENVVTGLTFLYGSDYDVDDEVYIGGTRKARIVRQTMTKTVFYIADDNRRLIVPNSQLYSLKCEKVMPESKDR